MNCPPWQLYNDKLCLERFDLHQLLKSDKTRVGAEQDYLPEQIVGELYVRPAKDDVPERGAAHANLAVVVLLLD